MSKITGQLFSYYHICKRKTWLSANGIAPENDHANVQLGKLLDENSYQREPKHIMVGDVANIDFMKSNIVCEIKKSKAEKEAAVAQVHFYLYMLRKFGVETTGELHVPQENYVEKIELTDADASRVAETISEIEFLISQTNMPPPPDKTSKCKACAFYDICYI